MTTQEPPFPRGEGVVYADAQHSGKYQLQVFPEAGHFIQEDLPEKTAMVLVDFYKRNDRSAMVLPPKVGELLKKESLSAGK